MSLLGSKPCHGSSVPSVDLRHAGVAPRGLPDSYSCFLPLTHSAAARTCLHSPLSITGTQAALHWLFSPAETILPPERSQAHPLLQVFVLLSLNMLAPASHLPTAGCLPPPSLLHCPSSHLLLHCKRYKDRICLFCSSTHLMDFPGGSDGKESACNAGDQGSIPGLGRSPAMATHSSILAWRIHMVTGAWRPPVHRVAKSPTRRSD